jgi:hypothetical protein
MGWELLSSPALSPDPLPDHPAGSSLCTDGSYLGINLLELEADHSPPSRAEVKDGWICMTLNGVVVQGDSCTAIIYDLLRVAMSRQLSRTSDKVQYLT